MDWRPLSEADIWQLIIEAENRMTIPQSKLWEVMKTDPVKWQEKTYGKMGGGFWVVALIGNLVVYYNDIENGFNISQYQQFGVISDYWCNQDDLEWSVQNILDTILNGGNYFPHASPPNQLNKRKLVNEF